MGENKRRDPAAQRLERDPGQRREGARWKIIGRLLLDGGTVERPRPSLSLELPPVLKTAGGRRKPGR